jgi:hypothetical protein
MAHDRPYKPTDGHAGDLNALRPTRRSARVASLGNSQEGFCAVFTARGHVECWGDDTNSALGDPSVGCASFCSTPREVVKVSGSERRKVVDAIRGNYEASCAPLTSPDVDCWGDDFGQLGNGSGLEGTDSPSPVSVFAPT